MNEMKEAVGNWREAKQFSPADENDFLRWLDKADTEEKLFSRLTFWFTFRGLPADQNQRYHLVQERARELRLWNGLELKLRRWQDRVADEYEQIGKEAFAARIGEDYADYINSLTDPEAAPQQAAPEPETAKPAGVQAWSARELSEMELPPIRHVVEGLLPMGMGVLVAKPKLGKSWMVLDLCLAVAQGEPFLGFPTRQHGTLYLALEDGKSRMQTRLRRLLEGRPAPANMHVMFQAQRLGEGLLETLGEYLDANPDIHLVCIDTLSKIKPKAKPFENAYDADYDYMGRLKAFADSRGICVLLVHHTRKSKNPEDSFDNINGSTGILGAADFTIVLDKQSRMDDEAGFLLTGRDIEQCERVIRFDKARCRWVMQGTAAQLPASPAYAGYDTALETPYDTAAYNRLLNAALGEQAEDETPLTLTLLVNEESSFKVSAAQEIAMYLNTARLTVTVEAVPWDTFLTRLESGDFDLYYGECRLTADWDLTALLSTEGSLNYGGWSDETTDRLLQAYRASGADANLVALWQQLLDTAPFAPICFKSVSVVTTEGVVQGLSPTETAPLSPLGGWSVRLDA